MMNSEASNQDHWEIVAAGKTVVSNTPEELWTNACAYFKWCKENPISVSKTLTSGKEAGKHVTNVSPRPFTIKGLCLHCGILEEYLRSIRDTKDKNSLYYIVVSKILYIIYIQNLEMATVGVFNPIFTAKVLGMEKEETPNDSIEVKVVQGLPELSQSENEVLEKLEKELKMKENMEEE